MKVSQITVSKPPMSPMLKNFLALVLPLILWTSAVVAKDGATIKGKIAIPDRFASLIEAQEITIELVEQVELPQPPLPEDWTKLKQEEQVAWWEKFQTSDEGKAFFEQREKLISEAKHFAVRLEKDNSFVVYDVPPGTFGFQGRTDKKIGDVVVAFEVFGQLIVADKTDEVAVGTLPVEATPLLENGQGAPAFVGTGLDGKTFDLRSVGQQPTLILFWSTESPPAFEFHKLLLGWTKEINETSPVSLISACLDRDADMIKKFLETNPLDAQVLTCGGWQGNAAQDFGIRSVPSLWLIKDQKLLMTDFEFGVALRVSGLTMKEIIVNRLQDKPIPNYPPPPPEEAQEAGEKDDGSANNKKSGDGQ